MGKITFYAARTAKKLFYSSFLLMFFVIGFFLGTAYYQHYLETGDTFLEWTSMERECQDGSLGERLVPSYLVYDCEERIGDYDKIRTAVQLEILLVFLMSVCDYIMYPKEHWVVKLWERIKSTSSE